jgi:hypothetical protein
MIDDPTTQKMTDAPQARSIEELPRQAEELTPEEEEQVQGGFSFVMKVSKASPKL